MNIDDNNILERQKKLETENHLLKEIVNVQKTTINRLINQFILQDSNNTKDNT